MKKKYMVTLTDEEQQLDRHLATNRPRGPAQRSTAGKDGLGKT